MIGTRSFTIPAEGRMLAVITSVLTLGTLALVLLAVGAIVAVAYLIDLALEVLLSLSMHIAILYSHSDPTLQLLMLCIAGFLILRPFHPLKRFTSVGR